MAVDRDGRTCSGPRKGQQGQRGLETGTRGCGKGTGSSWTRLGWAQNSLQESKWKAIRLGSSAGTDWGEMQKRQAKEFGPSDLGTGIWARSEQVITLPSCLPQGVRLLEVPLREESSHSPEGQCLVMARRAASRASCVGSGPAALLTSPVTLGTLLCLSGGLNLLIYMTRTLILISYDQYED